MSPASRSRLLPHLVHLALVLFAFTPTLFGGRMFYIRDVSTSYYPDYVFLHDALARGVWPLWNPTSDAGAPFFMPYPIVVLLVWGLGPKLALGAAPAFHVLLAMCGTTALARQQGLGPWGAWLAGSVLGFCGYVQTSLLFPLFLAVAWAPWILLVYARLCRDPTSRLAATLATLVALQLSTLGGEVAFQTGLMALLIARPHSKSAWRWGAASGGLAALLSAPVLLGGQAILQGTPRGAGFSPAVGLSFSAPWPVLVEALLPRFFGDPHTFSDHGFWGQQFFPDGYPYLLSLYLGLPVLLLALHAGRDRLWLAAALGVLVSLGSHGPLAGVLVPLMRTFRVPLKFFFLTSLAVALLAGRGLDRASHGHRARVAVFLPGLLLLVLGAALRWDPALPARWFAGVLPELSDWRALVVVSTTWPPALMVSGALCVAGGLALRASARLAPLAGVVAVLDVLLVVAPLNPTAAPSFYETRPELGRLLREAAAEGRYRFFSYGLTATPQVRFHPEIAARNTDYWLYAMERQSLLPRAHVFDGLEGAFDEDRNGLLPTDAALLPAERTPAFFVRHYRRLQLANVRFVLSYRPLPDDLVRLRGQIAFPEILDPLLFYELRDPLPRAFWVPEAEVMPAGASAVARLDDPQFDPRHRVLLESGARGVSAPAPGGPSIVTLQQPDPHTVSIRAQSPPGMVVVVQGYDAGWSAESEGHTVALSRANGRYVAFATPGGVREWTLRYRPAWVAPAMALLAAGILAGLACSFLPRPRPAS